MFANFHRQEPVAINSTLSVGELKKRLEQFKVFKRVLDEEEGITVGTIRLSYHYWANIDLMSGAVLASYLAL